MGDIPLRRILLIEDDHDVQTIIRLTLERLGGFEVETCSSGREALGKAGEAAADLILLDVMMPDLDGPTTLEGLRKIPGIAETPVVFVTAKAQPSEVEQYRQLGAVEVIVKPFDPMTICDQLREIWARSQSSD